jgi:hypothetical protein
MRRMKDTFTGAFKTVSRHFDSMSCRQDELWRARWPKGKLASFKSSAMRDPIAPGKVKFMIKAEGSPDEPERPRGIQGYHTLATQEHMGPTTLFLQKAVCATFQNFPLGDGIDATIASGMNGREIAQWMERCIARGVVAFYERDGKNWDSSIRREHLEMKCDLYELIDRRLAEFCRDGIKVSGFKAFKEGVLRYVLDGTVKSGHNDTSLGSGILDVGFAYEGLLQNGLSGSILVTGDDLLVAVYSDFDAAAVGSTEATFGIVPKFRKLYNPKDASFASGIFLPNRSEWVFLPKPGRLLAKLFWADSKPSKKNLAAYQRGVALGLMPTCGTLPLIRVLLRKFSGDGPVIASRKGEAFRAQDVQWDDNIWLLMADRYTIPAFALRECESWMETLPAVPLLLRHPVLDRILEVDLASLADREVDERFSL